MIDTDFEQHGESFRVFAKMPLNVLLSPTQTIKTMEQKTILEWLQYAKEQGYEWADAAIAMCDEDIKNERALNLTIALVNAFDWSKTPEGSEFWESTALNLNIKY